MTPYPYKYKRRAVLQSPEPIAPKLPRPTGLSQREWARINAPALGIARRIAQRWRYRIARMYYANSPEAAKARFSDIALAKLVEEVTHRRQLG